MVICRHSRTAGELAERRRVTFLLDLVLLALKVVGLLVVGLWVIGVAIMITTGYGKDYQGPRT